MTTSISPLGWTTLLLSWALLIAGTDARVVSAATRLASLDSPREAGVQAALMLCAYLAQYMVLGGVFEGTHPKGALRAADPAVRGRRRQQVAAEVLSGMLSLAVTVGLAVAYMALLEPRTMFYGYFETHTWTPAWGAAGVLAYIAAFDTHFFWSHWILHQSDFLWRNVHFFHHQYKEPSAFAQFAVHPLEAAVQGPFGHFFVQLFFPVHPVQLAIMGAVSSAWAFGAHDGRWFDFNDHYYHHSKGRGRKHYFNLGFITPFWDVVCGTRWHPQHPLWLEWEALNKKAVVADTRDGTASGVKNDAFGAYLDTKRA